jgi:excisionase family DNA binding protein
MLYTKNDAARLFHVCTRTIEREITSGRLKYRRIGSAVRFTREDLEQFTGSRFVVDTEKLAAPEERHTIPDNIIKTLEKELLGISHGSVTLTIHIRDSHPRFVIGRERSFIQDDGAEKNEPGKKAEHDKKKDIPH